MRSGARSMFGMVGRSPMSGMRDAECLFLGKDHSCSAAKSAGEDSSLMVRPDGDQSLRVRAGHPDGAGEPGH